MFERSVELITGPYRSGKTMWLLEELVRHSREQPLATRPVLLTVPSHRYKGLLEKQLAQILRQSGAPGLCAVKILPFYDLCHLILRQAGVNFHLLADGLRPAVLLKAIKQVESLGKLNSFASIANFAGTHAQMLELIDELMRAALSPREVSATLSRAASSESRYQELAAIYQAYWDELEKLNVYDERKLAFKVREILPQWAKVASPPALLAVDGFDRLSPLQLSVLSSLARHCERTLITFDYVSQGPKSDEYTWKQKSINGLLAFAEGGLTLKETQFEQSVPEVESELISTLDRQLEMEEVARQVKTCLVQGVEPSEIVVVTRSLQSYLPAVKLAFERAAIPYFPDEAIPIATLPLIKYVRRLLFLPLSKFKRVEVIRSLRSAFCNHEWLGLDKEAVDKLDRLSLDSVVVEESDWLEFIKQPGLTEESQALQRFFTLLQGEVVQKAASLSSHVAHVEDVIDALLRLPSDDEYSNPIIAWEEHQGLVELRKVLADLIREEELLLESYGSELYSYKQFFTRLEQAFENSNFRRRAGGDKFVTVCGADLVANRRFRVVIIAGLVEGDFPRRLERPGLLSRDEVRKWGSLGIDIENPRQHDSFEFSLYRSLLERAVDKVLLSYPHFESSNEELVPSFFLVGSSAQSKALPDCLPPRLAALQRPVSVEELALARLWYKGAGSVSDYLQKTLETNLPQDYAEEAERLLRRLQEPLAIVEARTSSESRGSNRKLACGDFSDLVALGLLKIDVPSAWSPSALSTYGRCPFQYWVSYVLKQEELEEPTAGLDIRLKGEVYHKALELFYAGLKERGLRLNSADQTFLFSFFEECIAAALNWVQTERKVKLDEFWEFERKDIAFRLRRFLKEEMNSAIKDNTGFEPVFFERSFGGEIIDAALGSRSAEVILQRPETLAPGTVKELRLRGRIDRIDADGQGRLRVVDYKSGSSPIKNDDILAGRELQMPIYSFAASCDNELISYGKVTAGLYLSISKGAGIGKVDFEDKEVDLLQVSRETIFDFVEKIAKGQFPVAPSKREVCQKCDHSAVCRIAELGAEED